MRYVKLEEARPGMRLAYGLFDSLGRKTAFDTSGWYKNNTKLQQRAEKYAKHFAQSQNMEKLNAFNVSFNVFNQSYISSVKAMEKGDKEKGFFYNGGLEIRKTAGFLPKSPAFAGS